MAVGRSTGFYEAYAPLLYPVTFIPFAETWENDPDAQTKERTALADLDNYLAEYGNETAAFIYEPLLQGSSGMRICRPSFLDSVLKRLKKYDVLLIADEILTGFGRTGTMFAGSQMETKADIICVSKGLTSGTLPLALTFCTSQIYDAFFSDNWDKALVHGHSFTANPIACAAACASLDLFEIENTMAKITKLSQVHKQCLAEMQADNPSLQSSRNIGLMGAITVKTADNGYQSNIKNKIAEKALEAGLLLRPLGNDVYIMSPACLKPVELSECYNTIQKIISEVV